MFRKILVVALIALPIAGICKQKNNKKKPEQTAQKAAAADYVDYKLMGAPLPRIRAVTEERTEIVNNDLKGNGNLLLMLFNPTCEHCIDMTDLMQRNISLFKDTKVLLMASANMMPYLSYFKNTVKASDFPSFKVAIDSSKAIDVLYNYVTLPQINIYNSEHKLIKTFNGDLPIDSLKGYIN